MHLRIVEFHEANAAGDKFFVEEGTRVWEVKTIFRIPWPRMVWNPLKKSISLAAGETAQKQRFELIGHKTYNEALDMVQELKKQIPIYHRVL